MKISNQLSSLINEDSATSYIPHYTYHVDEEIVYLRNGRVMSCFEINGFPFESTNDSEIVSIHEGLRVFFLSLCKNYKGIAMWSHMVKKRDILSNSYHIDGNDFLQKFYNKYIDSISQGNFYQTKYYLTVSIPVADEKNSDGIDQAIDAMKELNLQIKNVLKIYDVSALKVKKGNMRSEIGGFLGFILNHKNIEIPLSSNEISKSITNGDMLFGYDAFQLQNSDDNDVIFGTNYNLKDFPRRTEIGHLDFLLKLPYEFVLTQSFIPMVATKAIKSIESQMNKMASARSFAEIDAHELDVGLQAIQSGDSAIGSYHSVLTVFGHTFEEAIENGAKVSSEMLSSGKGFKYSKATYESVLSYFSHLPMSKNRPLNSQRSIGNFASLNSFHNFSYGKALGNPIGDGSAIMPLKTNSDSLYYMNTHNSPLHKNVTGQKIAGHALILGATGTGKTTLEATASAFLQRFDPYMFVVDYNRSTEMFVRAYGGVYFSIKEGVHTGLNPFQIGDADDLELLSFLKAWVKRLAVDNNGTPPTDKDAMHIDSAVESIMALPRDMRRFGMLLQDISIDTELGSRLSKWCDHGALAWAVDSPENTFNPYDAKIVGFDTTVILESVNGRDHPACEAILSVLFFYKNRMQRDGNLMLTIVEEFWKPCNFPMTQEMIKGALKAGRMKGEMIWLTSQSPEDAINCAIFKAIVEQTSTKICLPNPDAEYESYSRIGLTSKEFSVLKGLGRESRTMLIKQSGGGHGSSVFAKLDLYGFDDFLPILSGTKEGIAIAEEIIEQYGNDPNDWIPPFLEAVKKK